MSVKVRLAKLEQRMGGREELPDVIVYCVVEPGRLNDGYDRIVGDGREWHRGEYETSDAFLDRVEGEVKGPGKTVTLIAYQSELTHGEQA